MIPAPWIGLVLGLAAYRLTRLAGWDDFPLAAKVRAWAIGERWIAAPVEFDAEGLVPIPTEPLIGRSDSPFTEPTLEAVGKGLFARPELPGKQPSSEVEAVRPAYDRPTLAHLVHCPFCMGWWISLAVYVAWLAEPRWTLYGAAPLALSGFVGLVAKNLDP